MTTIDATLRSAVAGDADDLILTLDPRLQGLPDTAHGGSVLGLFDLLFGRRGARAVSGRYHRRVPLGVPLALTLAREADALVCRVADAAAGAVLVDGHAAGGDAAPAVTTGGPPGADAAALPISRTCFACGVDNTLGLRARLGFDARAVGGTWVPRADYATADGRLAPAALTTLLDETAFWLGALATGESGMTTDLAVTLHRDAPAGAAVTVAGERGATRARADDPRYWDTRVVAHDESGRLLATASITFVAVRGAARRLVTGLLAMNPPDLLRRIFPTYC
jgi:hypothetical protein